MAYNATKDWLKGFDAEIGEFLAAIREDRAPAVTGEDGRAALAIIQNIYRAAREGAPVLVSAGS